MAEGRGRNQQPQQAKAADATGEFARIAPHSIDAEVQVLGSMILDSNALDTATELLKEDFFFRPAHQTIYQTVVALRGANNPVEIVSLKNELARLGKLEAIGGVEYLAALVEGVPSAANVEYYAKIVRDKALLRELIQAGSQLVAEAYDTRQDAQEVIDRAEQQIFKIAQQQIGSDATPINSLLQETFEILQANEGKVITGVASGYSQLDEMTSGFQNSEMIILAARPSMGKTSCLLNIAEYMAVVDKVPVVIYSLEMSKQQLALRLLSSHARFNLRNMRRGTISPDDWSNLQTAAGSLEQSPIIIDDDPDLTILKLRAKTRRYSAAYGIKCVFIDYLQLMKYVGRADSRQEQITEISRGIKSLARELDIPVITAAQLNRGPEDRPTHRPRMSDLRESGSIEQDADVVMLLHNEDYYHINEPDYIPTNLTEIIIAKQRNGPTGGVNLTFLKDITRFESAAAPMMEPNI